MDRHGGAARPRRRKHTPALHGDARARAEERLRRGRTERDDGLWLDRLELRLEPRPAGAHLARVGLRVDPQLAARAPLEVLHGVGEIDLAALEAGPRERAIEQLPRRPDERPALAILLVARLLADSTRRACAGPSPSTACVALR